VRTCPHCRLAALVAGLLLISSCELIEDITKDWTGGEASFIPTPMEVAERMLDMAQVGASDVVYDLGSGDGRIVISAAEKYGARGVGIEIDPKLVERSREEAKRRGVSHLVEFRVGDIRKADVSEATVVMLYLTADMNLELRPAFERQLKPGTRVVSHDHAMDGWTPARVETVAGTWYHDHRIYLWEVGRTK
jgi:SAM-dependent methyltransferase